MTDDRWIRRFVPSPEAASRLVCLPHAGGAASYYLPVAKGLAPAVDVLAIQYPGRQDRRTEPALGSVAELADGVFDALQPWTDKPITIFGHSLGGSIAFELTRRLEQAGVMPAALFVSGRRAPSTHREAENSYLLDDAGLIAEVKALGGASSHLLDDEDIRQMVLPAIRADYRAAETYRWTPGPKLATPIFMFTGDADPKVTSAEARAWREHTEGEFVLRVFPGDHFYLDQHAPEVIAAIAAHAAQAVR
jgi:surfactin synthase thioesterase subunit